MEFPQGCMEEFSNTTGLEGRIDAAMGTEFQCTWRAMDPPPQLIRIDLWALGIDPDPMEGSDLLYRGVLQNKGHPLQSRSIRIANYLELVIFLPCYISYYLFTESIDGVNDSNFF